MSFDLPGQLTCAPEKTHLCCLGKYRLYITYSGICKRLSYVIYNRQNGQVV